MFTAALRAARAFREVLWTDVEVLAHAAHNMAVGTFRPPRSFCVWCRTYRTTRSSRVRPSRTSGILSRTYVTSISIITPPPPPGGRKVQPRPQPHPSSTRAQRNAPQRERGHSVCRSGPVVHGAARRTECPRSPRNHFTPTANQPKVQPRPQPQPWLYTHTPQHASARGGHRPPAPLQTLLLHPYCAPRRALVAASRSHIT